MESHVRYQNGSGSVLSAWGVIFAGLGATVLAYVVGIFLNKTVLAFSTGLAMGSLGGMVRSFSLDSGQWGYVAAWVICFLLALFVAAGSQSREAGYSEFPQSR